MTRWYFVMGLVMAGAVALPAAAQQAASVQDFLGTPPAATGKTVIFDPPPAPVDSAGRGGCALVSACSLRLIGSVRRNGAVVIEATALRW